LGRDFARLKLFPSSRAGRLQDIADVIAGIELKLEKVSSGKICEMEKQPPWEVICDL